MSLTEQKALIEKGKVLGPQEEFIAFDKLPVVFKGFHRLSRVQVELNNETLHTLVPDLHPELINYAPAKAIVILENEKPVLAIIKGERYYSVEEPDEHQGWRKVARVTEEISLVNLSGPREQAIVKGSKTQTLTNDYIPYWPGYSLYNHYEQLRAGQERLSVASQGNGQFELSFERVTPAYGV